MACNICGSDEFVDMKPRTDSVFVRKKVKCASCGSLERHRLIWEFVSVHGLNKPSRWLHMAPEKCLRDKISKVVGDGYICGDKNIDRYKRLKAIKIDLCTDLGQFEPASFDVVMHNHVIEHVRCNYTVVLQRLHGLLRPGGWHIFSIPFLPGGYRESLESQPDDERVLRFGQWDHHRVFSPDDVHETIGMIFDIPEKFDARSICNEARLRELHIPENQWVGFNNNSLFCVRA